MFSRGSMRFILATAACGIFCASLCSCSQVLLTGREQLILVPSDLVNSMGRENYSQFITTNKLSSDQAKTQMVQQVGTSIKNAVEKYCILNGKSELVEGFEWEFNLIEDKAVNAFAMPGGGVVVYTGLFTVAKDRSDLAVVIAHEIAHVVARHGSERLSQALLVELGGVALADAMKEKPEKTRQVFLQSYSIGTAVGLLLPYSRVHENEADHLGLIFMAMAGYDPSAAVGFWERMSQSKKPNGSVPEFLSTHPADTTRIENIKALLPEAQSYYTGSFSPAAPTSTAAGTTGYNPGRTQTDDVQPRYSPPSGQVQTGRAHMEDTAPGTGKSTTPARKKGIDIIDGPDS